MSNEYDELDDLLDDDELYTKIVGRDSSLTVDTSNNVPGQSADDGNNTVDTKPPQKDKQQPSEGMESEQKTSGLESVLEKLMIDDKPDDALRTLLSQLAGESHSAKDGQSNSESKESSGKPQSFEDTISETMSRLQAQKTGSDDSEDVDTLAEMLKALQSDQNSSQGPMADGVDGILGTLLGELATKDVLYEPLKELHSNYPDWIARNEKSIDKKDLERYRKQQKIVASIVEVYESPDYSDKNVKYRDFVTEQMSEMQSTGAPPPELVENSSGDGIPGLNFDDNLPEMPSECATQ